ncbi:MAG: helix-turn-helix domain-containing protein [Longimicrobiaceae bacterium]
MTTDERLKVGHRLRAVRERLGWDRSELARRLGVHAGSIARWETGGAVPHPYTVRRIAELAGTTAEWLRTGRDDSAPEAREEVGDPFSSDVALRFMGEIAPPGDERLRKLDALEGLRRLLTARGTLPGWWYELRERAERGTL